MIILNLPQVFAHENWEGQNNWLHNYRPDGGEQLIFNYTYDPKPADKSDSLDEAKKYINATVTQLFYTANLMHDLFYRYVLYYTINYQSDQGICGVQLRL
jgi:extracellular elastinolytic metalloproteinase